MKKILIDPDPRLRKACAEVTNIDRKITSLADELLSVIRHIRNNPDNFPQQAIGIAAPQVGELLQLFVIDMPAYSLTMVNPLITKTAGSHRVVETCLSLPGRYFLLERPKVVKIKGLDLEGRERSIKLHDVLAQALIHEVEHLKGIMVDKVALAEVFEKDLHA